MKRLNKKGIKLSKSLVTLYTAESGKTNTAGGSCGGKSNTGETCGDKSNNTGFGC